MNLISETQPGGGVPLYQLKITLKWSKPPIWRRVVVRADMTLDRLHDIIQIAMGWTDSHLHQFIAGSGVSRTYYGRPNPEFADMGSEMLNEKRYSVADLAPTAKRKFIYEYDFGDGWEHDVVVEKILPPDPAFKHPMCLAGANACPPEDCGGIGGYYNLLKILRDPQHPDHADMKDWIGGDLNAEEFSVEGVNRIFKRLKP
ncbi:MAG: Plasmid pRiA4b ORF-3-like protein [Verrucomicrobia bacterium ADurb.Bin118]|nr:MAG: Plasmid pRiA4b ORF-3-like protein [Verrucomicrobia bacterium ADurb.Bin118]